MTSINDRKITDLECIYTKFEDGKKLEKSMGFVKRSSGKWSWCLLNHKGNFVKDGDDISRASGSFTAERFVAPALEVYSVMYRILVQS